MAGINLSGRAFVPSGLISPPYVLKHNDFSYNIWRILSGVPTNLTNDDPVAGADPKHNPVLSPDETMIAYCQDVQAPDFSALYVMDADGSNRVQIDAVTNEYVLHPYWRPDSGKIVYTVGRTSLFAGEVYEINPDGTGKTLLATPPDDTGAASDEFWRPQYNRDGTKLVWGRILNTPDSYEIWTANADGSSAIYAVSPTVLHQAGSQYAFANTSDRLALYDGDGMGGWGDVWTFDPDGNNATLIASASSRQITKMSWATDDALVYGVGQGVTAGLKLTSYDAAGGPVETVLNEAHGTSAAAIDRKGCFLYRGRLWFVEWVEDSISSMLPDGTDYQVGHLVTDGGLSSGIGQGQGFEYL